MWVIVVIDVERVCVYVGGGYGVCVCDILQYIVY